ncbi:hypothetical protein ACFWAT_28390 [Streptomyces syringium]|uniref:hypothetical protein n=1 Tax=Streptomyces syringium TaxID=76729 RepID=UPI00365AE12E
MIDIFGAAVAGTPWWAACLIVAFASLAGFCLRALRLLIPDNSRDRLKWWIAVLEHRRRTASKDVEQRQADGKRRQAHDRRDKEGNDST